MVIAGRVENGVVVLEHGASLPEGTEVSVLVAAARKANMDLTQQDATLTRPLPEGEETEPGPVPKGEGITEGELARRLEIIERIAALPIEGATDPFSGKDHDRILYGSP